MTALYIGGAHQGKRALAQRTHGIADAEVFSGGAAGEVPPCARMVSEVHLLVRRTLRQGKSAAELLPALRGKILVCDELGCGIVPMDAAERDWREQTGRLCCALAAEADLVVRVIAGTPQVLRGRLP